MREILHAGGVDVVEVACVETFGLRIAFGGEMGSIFTSVALASSGGVGPLV